MSKTTIPVLAINTSVTPVATQLHDVAIGGARDVLLELLNKLGKNSHHLIKWDGKMYAIHHTAPRGPSKKYYKSEVSYHPFSHMLTENS